MPFKGPKGVEPRGSLVENFLTIKVCLASEDVLSSMLLGSPRFL